MIPKLNLDKPHAVITGFCDFCPGARYEQAGKMFSAAMVCLNPDADEASAIAAAEQAAADAAASAQAAAELAAQAAIDAAGLAEDAPMPASGALEATIGKKAAKAKAIPPAV